MIVFVVVGLFGCGDCGTGGDGGDGDSNGDLGVGAGAGGWECDIVSGSLSR